MTDTEIKTYNRRFATWIGDREYRTGEEIKEACKEYLGLCESTMENSGMAQNFYNTYVLGKYKLNNKAMYTVKLNRECTELRAYKL